MKSKQWCCVQWEAMAPEVALAKDTEISQIVEKSGIPSSIFALSKKLLTMLHQNCPACGKNLMVEDERDEIVPVKNNQQPVKKVEGKVIKTLGKCPSKACVNGFVADGIKCDKCLGFGEMNTENSAAQTE